MVLVPHSSTNNAIHGSFDETVGELSGRTTMLSEVTTWSTNGTSSRTLPCNTGYDGSPTAVRNTNGGTFAVSSACQANTCTLASSCGYCNTGSGAIGRPPICQVVLSTNSEAEPVPIDEGYVLPHAILHWISLAVISQSMS